SLDRALARAIRHHRELVVFFIDLDGFKQVNDEFGHATGDQLLVEVARRLRSLTRKEDAVSRISGDEFCTFCAEIQGPDAADSVAARMTTHLGRAAQLGSHEIAVSASIGAAQYPADGSTVHELLRKADSAMYRVKREGGDGYAFFSEAPVSLADPV
ncbi:MAG: GGDEF domain-containing protein, partial [Acidobacteria bacterium]|nr:GGDEF domain-containing protein [Acidobacteriota bacterium]